MSIDYDIEENIKTMKAWVEGAKKTGDSAREKAYKEDLAALKKRYEQLKENEN